MFAWLKKLIPLKADTITGAGNIRFSMERLQDRYALHISGDVVDENDPRQSGGFAIIINDPTKLKELYGILKLAVQHDPYEEALAKQGLLEGEPANIYNDIEATLGRRFTKTWIHDPNLNLGGKTPHEMIREGSPWRVREILRQVKHVGIS